MQLKEGLTVKRPRLCCSLQHRLPSELAQNITVADNEALAPKATPLGLGCTPFFAASRLEAATNGSPSLEPGLPQHVYAQS